MKKTSQVTRYRAVDLRNVSDIPQWDLIDTDLRAAIEVVAEVLPFRTNRYVTDHLIDWSRVPDDPIFQLVFPQLEMLASEDFRTVRHLLGEGAALLSPQSSTRSGEV